ncbi:MAG: CDP-diacylglycerol--serine O-phosphatidyltransferase [Desulfomonile sp.]|nr:CDP-diacylglycerol--serine O-phosphatidyltransferase [Desulfomonile sp.]
MANSTPNKRKFFRRKRKPLGPDAQVDRAMRRAARITKMKKGIFILPSLLTLTSIFLSFSAVIFAINGEFVWAAGLVIAAAFFDGIDGRVARLTKTTTRFGVELDSLADVISFGVAPALLMYLWALTSYGRVGWVVGFVFVACGALRLARFNVQSGVIDPRRFNGLPIPAAACMVATTVLFFEKVRLDPETYRLFLLIMTFGLSFLMVSGVKFHAFKDLGFAREKPFTTTVGFVLLLALVATQPFVVPFLICAAYVVSGPILTWALLNRTRKRHPEGLLGGENMAEEKNNPALPT